MDVPVRRNDPPDFRRRAGVLLHSQREDALPRRLGRRRADGILWRLAFDGFSWYIARNSRLAFIQGSIAAVVVFLLWIYVSSVILMYGVEFTAAYARLRRHRPDEMPAAPTPRV